MTSTFAYVVDQSVMHVFADCKARERHELLRIFRHLAANPNQRGDYVQRTASLREIQVKRFGKWLVSYWPDSAVGELRVVDMRKLVPVNSIPAKDGPLMLAMPSCGVTQHCDGKTFKVAKEILLA